MIDKQIDWFLLVLLAMMCMIIISNIVRIKTDTEIYESNLQSIYAMQKHAVDYGYAKWEQSTDKNSDSHFIWLTPKGKN